MSTRTRSVFTAMVLCIPIVAGCAPQPYGRVRLGESKEADVAAAFGQDVQHYGRWSVVRDEATPRTRLLSMLVLYGEGAVARAKTLWSLNGFHWVLFMTADFDERVELRLDPAEIDAVARRLAANGGKASWRDRWALLHVAPPPERPPATSAPATPSATSASSAPEQGPGEASSTSAASVEQLPMALMLDVYKTASWTTLTSSMAAKKESSDNAADTIIAMFSLGSGLVSMDGQTQEALLKTAEQHRLYSSPAPTEFRAGEWQVRKLADGWYSLSRHSTFYAPPWAIFR